MVAGDLRNRRKLILAGVFIIAICLRLAMGLYYFDISGDKIYQTAAAMQISQGKGYTVPVADPSNLDVSYYKAMILWPPFYSASLATLITITGDIPVSSFILDSINNIIFLALVYWICTLLNFPFLLSMLILLFKATEINDTVFASTPTDYMALNCWLATIAFGVKYLTAKKNIDLVAFIVLNVLAPWIRYSSIPIVLVLPVLLILMGAWKGEKAWMKGGAIGSLIAIAGTLVLLYFNFNRSGNFFYVLETTKGFYPENILHLPPVLWMSMVNINFPLTQLSLRTDIPYGTWSNWLKISNALLIFILLWYILKSVKWSHLKQKNDTVTYFFILAAALTLGTLGSLTWLSITRSRNFQVDQFWTYIEEHRYLLIVTITLMYYFIIEFIVKKKKHFLGYLFVFIMIVETAHGIWIVLKGPLSSINESSLLYVTPKTKKLIENRQQAAARENAELILIDEDYDLRGYAVLNNIKIIDDPRDLDHTNYRSTKGIFLVFRMKPGHESLYRNFMSQQGVNELARMEHAVFYELHIPPSK